MSNFIAKIEEDYLVVKIPISSVAKETEKMMLFASSGGFQSPQNEVEYNGETIKINLMAGYYKPRPEKKKKQEHNKLGW